MAVLDQNTLHHDLDARPGHLAQGPVNGHLPPTPRLDRRPGEPDLRRTRHGIARYAGEPVGPLTGLTIDLAAEAILAAARFIPDHGDVLPRAQLGRQYLNQIQNQSYGTSGYLESLRKLKSLPDVWILQ